MLMIDTAGFYSLLDSSDHWNEQAVQELRVGRRRFTHNYVLSELVSLAWSRKKNPWKFIDFAKGLLTTNEVEILWVDRQIHIEAHQLLDTRRDKQFSHCDAISFVLMKRMGITDALTTDKHFEQEGFTRLLA